MKKQLMLFVCCVVLGCIADSSAQEYKKIDAKYTIASKTIIDPPPEEKRDQVLLFLQGSGAKEIFDSMPVPAKKSKCSADVTVKTARDLECFKNISGAYHCTVGILLNTGNTARGSVC